MFFHVGAGCSRARPRSTAQVMVLAVVMALVFTFVVAGVPATARAGTYPVSLCGTGDGSAGSADGMTTYDDGGSDGYMDTMVYCSSSNPSIVQYAYLPTSYSSWTWNGNGWWAVSAPANTSIAQLTLHQTFAGFQSYFTFDLYTPDGRLLERAATWGGSMTTSGTRTFVINTGRVTGRFYCALSSCSGTGTSVVTDRVDPTIEDDHAPTFDSPPSGSLLSSGSVSGVRGVAFSASDLGGGIYTASLLIDGVAVQTVVPNRNGGRCLRPFTTLVPCQLQVSGSISFDTARLREGDHQVQVAVTDATGTNTTVSAPTTITVDNVPLPSGGVPSIEGSTTAGTTLTAKPGVWDGATGTYGFEWQRCEADGTGCENVAAGSTYTLTLADVGSRLRVRVTAQNSAGEQASALSALTAVVQEKGTDALGRSESPGQAPPAVTSASSGAPNGQNASVNVRLDASFGRGRRLLVTRAGKRGLRIIGRLLNADDGRPISAAAVEQTFTTPGGHVKAGRALTTSARGTFAIMLPHSPVSGRWTLRYRPRIGAPVVASVTLRLRVRAQIAWRASSAHHVLTFSGRISRPVPRRPVQYVEVQWRRGGSWQTLAHPIAVARTGRWALRYAVGANVAAGQRFRFRVSIRQSSTRYPYDATASGARWVTVR